MARRKVVRKRIDKNRDVIAMCNPNCTWSPVLKAEAIREIKSEVNDYYLQVDSKDVDIVVLEGMGGEYLSSDPKETATNALLDLPDC